MKFTKYNSIENSHRSKYINKIAESGQHGGEWCVKEKIHGSNFAIYFDGETIEFGKRSGFIREDENFYNYLEFEEYAKEIMPKIKKVFKDAEYISLHGEIFGGYFDHPDVPNNNTASQIQKGVMYSPDHHVFAFDLKVDGEFVDNDIFDDLCENLGIKYIKTLFTGTFEECLNFSTKFDTTIPAELGLPALPEGSNICEGTVIKPNDARFLGDSRVILKNKNPEFSEKAKGDKDKKVVVEAPLEENLQKCLDEMLTYVTENRLRNVLSHMGDTFTDKDFGKILGLFNKDVIEDYLKDNDLNEFTKLERKKLTKRMSVQSSLLVRNNILNIIDGNF